jgi:ComEC/Rec2-related protein
LGPTARIWLAAAALSFGCAFGAGLPIPLIAALCGAGISLQGLRRRTGLAAIGLVIGAFALGSFDAGLHATEGTELQRSAAKVPRCTFDAKVLEDAGGLGTLIGIESISCDRSIAGPGVAIVRESPGDPGMTFTGNALFLPLGPESLDRVLTHMGVRARLYDLTVRTSRPPTGWQAMARTIRESLIESTSATDGDEAALLRGLAIGDTSELDGRIIEEFRRSGLSHIVAVSGSNVAIVLAAVMLLVAAASLRLRIGAAAAGLALFVLVVGPDPSVLRAAAMGGIALATLLFGYRARPLNVLGLAVIAIVGLRPGIVWALGLHLSLAATAGLILFMAPISRRLEFLPGPVAAIAAATLAAQIAVAPILAASFGEISVVAPLANLLAIPAVAPATILSLMSAVLGLAWPAGGRLLAALAAPFARWILWVAHRAAGWDHAVLPMPWPVTVLVTTAVIAAAWVTLRQPVLSES